MFIYQVNIVGAYLESLLNNHKFPIFMRLPQKIYKLPKIRKRLLGRLLRSLYGCKQLGGLSNQNVIAFQKSIGFKQLNGDPNILIRQTKNKISIISVYVDNFFWLSKAIATLEALKKLFSIKYETNDLGDVKTIIGQQITRDLVACPIKIDHSVFIRDLINEEGLIYYITNIISIKARSTIQLIDPDDYKETQI